MKLLITGGARSGKSRYAQARAEALGDERTYLATSRIWDDEMAERVRLHRADRGPGWRTLEEPLDIEPLLRSHQGVLLLDCLTLWVTNLMMDQGEEADLWPRLRGLRQAVHDCPGDLIIVTNEVGLGIVPLNAMARRFRDWSGWLSQEIAQEVDEVVLMAAGLPLHLKGGPARRD